MSYKIGVRPGKPASVAGMVAGGLFILLGVFVVIPLAGFFGIVWTAFAAIICLYNAYNVFSARGVSAYEVDVQGPRPGGDFAGRLRELERLKDDGLVSDEEYRSKRAEIMGERW